MCLALSGKAVTLAHEWFARYFNRSTDCCLTNPRTLTTREGADR